MRELRDGEIVNVDVSVYYNGYHGDLNETFFVGNVDEDSVRLVKCAYDALAAAIDLVRPGTLYRLAGNYSAGYIYFLGRSFRLSKQTSNVNRKRQETRFGFYRRICVQHFFPGPRLSMIL